MSIQTIFIISMQGVLSLGYLPFLANIFLEQYKKDYPESPESFSTEALGLLQSLSWPDNVRGLQNVVRHLCMTGKTFCFNGVIELMTVRVILRERELLNNDSGRHDSSTRILEGNDFVLATGELRKVVHELRQMIGEIARVFSAFSTVNGETMLDAHPDLSLEEKETASCSIPLEEPSRRYENILGNNLLDAFENEPFDVQKVIILFAFQIASLLRKFNGSIDLKKLINVMKQELLKASFIQFCASQDNPLIVSSVRNSCDYILKRTQCRISPLKANLDKLLYFDSSEFDNFSAENNLPSYAFVCFFRLFKTSFTQSTIDFDLNKTLQFLGDLIIFFLLNKADISDDSVKVSNSRVAQKLSLNTQSIINSLKRSEQSIRAILSTYPDLRICQK